LGSRSCSNSMAQAAWHIGILATGSLERDRYKLGLGSVYESESMEFVGFLARVDVRPKKAGSIDCKPCRSAGDDHQIALRDGFSRRRLSDMMQIEDHVFIILYVGRASLNVKPINLVDSKLCRYKGSCCE
jgi:hypothetical protein